MTMTETMNKAQAAALFEQESILFGTRDGIPEDRAVELLGADAVKYVKAQQPGSTWNGCGNGKYTAMYLTLSGFYAAVTYNNVSILEARNERSND